MAEKSIIDRDALRRLLRAMGGDMDDLKELFESFLDDTPPLFETMRKSAAAEDWSSFKRAAHTAKGAARDFGAIELAEFSALLESEASGGRIIDASQRIDRLIVAFSTAAKELESLLKTGDLG